MKVLKIITVLLFIVFVGIQFIPITRNESNKVLSTSFNNTFNPPVNISKQLKASCYDCHSNNTNYPWYNKVQPVSWFLERHIKEGKDELNFSEFGDYSNRKQKSKLKSIISQINDDKMPPPSYILMHWNARISESGKLELEKWLTGLRDSL